MSRTLEASIAVAALLALLAGPGLAQQTAPAQTPAPAATATVTLPPALQAAGLTDVTAKAGRHGGTRIEGKLPDGNTISALLDEQGKLRGLRGARDAALPWSLTDQLLPASVRENAIFAQIDSLDAVFVDERGIMLAGQDSDKKRLRAVFAQDGTLVRFDRGEDADRGDGKRGKRHDDRRDHRRDKGHDRSGQIAPANQQQGALPAPERVRQALTAAGYSGIGDITRDGARVMALAVNPEGEQVTLELNAQAQVTREINR